MAEAANRTILFVEFVACKFRATTGNTSNLLSHLKNKHPKVHSEVRLLICPSERLFSSSGHIVNSLRGNLNPEKVNMLVFLNNNL